MNSAASSAAALAGRRVLVTGARGFIGNRLTKRLAAAGAEVHAVSRAEVEDEPGVRWWAADLADEETTSHLVRSCAPDFVMHLASHVAGSPDAKLALPTLRSNLLSTVNLLVASEREGCERFLLAGTMMEPDAADAVPNSPYAASKWASSEYGRMFTALYGLPVVNLRLFMVYGPGQAEEHKLLTHVTLSLLRGEVPRLASGRWEVDWVFVEDVVDAFLAGALRPGVEGETVDIGSGELRSIRSVVLRIADLIGGSVEPEFGARADRPLEEPRRADVKRARRVLGWAPVVGLEEGLSRMVAWHRERLEAGVVD